MIVFDKNYNYLYQFAQWTVNNVYFYNSPDVKCGLQGQKTVRKSNPEKNKSLMISEEFFDIKTRLRKRRQTIKKPQASCHLAKDLIRRSKEPKVRVPNQQP